MRDSEYRKTPEEAPEKLSREDQEAREDLLYILSIMEKQGAVGITQPVDYRDALRYKERLPDYLQEVAPEGSVATLFDEVIFDFDGVLYDSMYSVYKAVELMLEERADRKFTEGATPDEASKKFTSPFPTFYARFGIKLTTEDEKKSFVQAYRRIQAEVNNMHHAPAALFPEAKAVLMRLHEAKKENPNLRIHIISAGSKEHVHDVLERYQITEIFDQIHPECHDKTEQIRIIAEEADEPSRTVMIGDLPSDIKDAQSISGVRTIAIARTKPEKERLGMFLPDYVIGSLDDLFALKPHNKELAGQESVV